MRRFIGSFPASVRLPIAVSRLLMRGAGQLTVRNEWSLGTQRRALETACRFFPPPRGTTVELTRLNGVSAERLVPPGPVRTGTLLYFHGGGYAMGSARTHRSLVGRLAAAIGIPAVVPNYALAPEHGHPAALNDALESYRALLEQGFLPEQILLAGDSAGAGLALALAMAARDSGMPLPAAIGMLCPWLDLSEQGSTRWDDCRREPVLTARALNRWAEAYCGDSSRKDETVSPIFGDLGGLPPMVVHSAGDDPLAHDAEMLENLARSAGVSVEHGRYPELWHVFHACASIMAEADQALSDFGTALRKRLASPRQTPRVGIIGAGMSGLCLAAVLQKSGIDSFTIYEKADDVGGTWRENTYPGVACDVPGRYYSYSFALNPEWSCNFASGQEILAYFKGVADRFDLRRHIRFRSEVQSARWAEGRWHLHSADGSKDVVDVLVCATGFLHHPRIPEIPGLGDFDGACFHSARWDHSVPLEGQRIGVIGTGASATQIISTLAGTASELKVFQRSPQWMLPGPYITYSRAGRWLVSRFPRLNELSYRTYRTVFERVIAQGPIQPGWQRWCMSNGARLQLRLRVKDPELRKRLTPQYEPMCKRLILSSKFYSAVQKQTVDLVTAAIDHIDRGGVVTADGRLHEVDILVLATGFDFQAFMRPMRITGDDGLSLDDAWEAGPRGYDTVALPGFPNLFMMSGPTTPVGNHALTAVAETQAAYIVRWIEILSRGGIASAAPTEEATDLYNKEIRGAMSGTAWTTGCSSWYLGPDGTPMLWPWSPQRYREMLREPRLADFKIAMAEDGQRSQQGA